ncbi:hypothetical protein ILUMI_02822 [Ignelater luminosus]|uniref:HAT C-terminal dimerisation domain-containing protein n=1 Tax=Ignelater luminosus TaxID=2038154 RepID=A0A8K0DHH1_IGNLU|nr:hypothetical protein ILUMI_02822 [Ignelater luminosus]
MRGPVIFNNTIEKKCPNLECVQDVLDFWRSKKATMPNLAQLARKVICVPATSALSKRVFLVAGLVLNSKRAQLSPDNANRIVFIHDDYEYVKQFVEMCSFNCVTVFSK